MTKCLVCPGDSGDNYCKVGETGESEDCGGPVTNRVCFEMGSKDRTDEQHIKRAGCVNLEDAKNKFLKLPLDVTAFRIHHSIFTSHY